jgi:pimeloyl-ACP methyl ester carboxylesterase
MTGGTAVTVAYAELPNKLVRAANGVGYAYREAGDGGVPLVLLQHFRGNLDGWDQALIDALASGRRVVTFDNTGVGGLSGQTPGSAGQMARDVIAFITALGLGQADMLGFSIGSFVTQEIALIRPGIVRRLVLASSAPQGAAGMRGWAPEVIGAVGAPRPARRVSRGVLHSVTGQPAGRAGDAAADLRPDRGPGHATTWQTREAQYDAVRTWGIPDHALLQRLSGLQMPVFVANGDRDPMILPHYSHLLAGLIPHARVKIYPASAHGFLFQHLTEFAGDVDEFLAGPGDGKAA